MDPEVPLPGAKLKAARESLGKTPSEMAKLTRITVQQIHSLESNDYSKIPAPMYVRGFLKLYSQALGINPEPLIEAYDASLDGGSVRKRSHPPPEPVESDSPVELPGIGRILGAVSRHEAEEPAEEDLPKERTAGGLSERFQSMSLQRLWPMGAGLAVALVLLLVFRSCDGSGSGSGPDGDPETDPPPDTVTVAPGPAGLPEIEDPLYRQPDPVVFELPRTLE